MKTDNLKFSNYRFSLSEKIFADKTLTEELQQYENTIQYMLIANYVSNEEAEKQIQAISKFLKELGKNPNHEHYTRHEVVYITNEYHDYANPAIFVSFQNWTWLHGLFCGYWFHNEIDEF